MPENNEALIDISSKTLPSSNVITDLKFGSNTHEIGIGKTTRTAIEGAFSNIDNNLQLLDTAIQSLHNYNCGEY